MGHQDVNRLFLFAFEEVVFLLAKLCDNLRQEVKSINLILRVFIHTANNSDNLFQNLWLRQKLEEGLIFTEIRQYLTCVESHVQICGILRREHIYQRIDHHGAFLFQNLLHAFLIGCKLLFVLIGRLDIRVTHTTPVAIIPFVLLLRLNLLLNQFDE